MQTQGVRTHRHYILIFLVIYVSNARNVKESIY